MKLQVSVGAILALVALSSARTVRQNQRAHFLGDGSNDIAVNILQSMKNSKENAVFSPLGYTTILAILTEGARGNTRNQLVSSLKLPEDTYAVRSTYKRILSEMTERQVMNKPQFQNWFYVYKNYSVEQSYKDLLKDNYLVDVKEVERDELPEDQESSSSKPMEVEGTTAEQPTQPMEMVNANDKIVEESIPEGTTKKADSSEEDDKSKEKSKESAEKKGSKEKESEENESKEDESSEDKSKEDESKEDSSEDKEKPSKKASNVMKIKEKEKKDKPAMDVKESGSEVIQKSEEEKLSAAPEDVKKVPETADSVTTDRPSEEAMQSEVQAQSVDVKAGQVDGAPKIESRSRRDMASALSTNKLIDTERQSILKRMSRMMAFNALFFQGNWSSKFSLKKEKMPFRMSATEQKMIKVLHAEGEFETGRVPDLDAWALDLPYQGERYSLLILVPASDDGLDGLIQRLDGFSFYNIDKHLTKLPAQVCIPKLKFYTISKPKDAFIKSGITDIFTEEADLSGISGSKGLFLEQLVQIVTFDIDENESSYNYLTTSDVSDTRSTPVNFSADRPFLFFLRDKVENLNIVTGMVKDPVSKDLDTE